MKKGFIVGGLLSILVVSNSFAYRPLGTEDAGVAGKGVAQTEISWDHLKWKNNDTEQVWMLVPIYGVTANLELSVEIPYLIHRPDAGKSEEGIGDVNIVAKYLLVPGGDENPAFTVKGVVKMDNGDYDKGLGSGDKDYSVIAVASETVGQLTGHGQYGYTWIGNKKDENLRNITLYGVALDYAASEPFHLLAEVNGNRHPDRTAEEDPRNALIGATYKISDKLTLDAAYKWGLNDESPDWGTTVGMSITY